MANMNKKEQHENIDFTNLIVEYTEGDVRVFDGVTDINILYPLKPMTNLIVLCTSGNMKMNSGGCDIELRQGDLMICPPNVSLKECGYSKDFSCRILCLSDHIIQGLLSDKIELWHHSVYINQLIVIQVSSLFMEEFGHYFALINSNIFDHPYIESAEPLRPSEPFTRQLIVLALLRAQLLEICFLLYRLPEKEATMKLSQGKILFNRFLSLVSNSEIKRQPIALYASKLAITPKYLTMLCLKYSNKTASDWVIQYTTEEIRFYLRSSNLSIKEISAKMGFSNMSHFGSYVRKHLGVSPSHFRHGRGEF